MKNKRSERSKLDLSFILTKNVLKNYSHALFLYFKFNLETLAFGSTPPLRINFNSQNEGLISTILEMQVVKKNRIREQLLFHVFW
jgi:hypothetical protein